MSLIVADRVKETCAAPGTGTVSLLGASTGFQSFSSAIGDGNTCYYTISDQGGANWEVGIGTYASSGNTLARTTVLSSSAGGTTKADFSTGTQDVFVTYPAEVAVYSSNSPSTSGYVLTANGTGVAPSWQSATSTYLTNTFSGDGTTTGFTLTVAPTSTSSILVAITGVVQDPSTYTLVGTTLNFSAAPPTGTSNISVRYLGIAATPETIINKFPFFNAAGSSSNISLLANTYLPFYEANGASNNILLIAA